MPRVAKRIVFSCAAFGLILASGLSANAEARQNTREDTRQVKRTTSPPPFSRANLATVTKCDRLTTHWRHPDRVTAGIGFGRINPQRAIPACIAAVNTYPEQRRFHYQLARAYDRQGNFQQARKSYETAAGGGDPFAMLALAVLDARGQGGPQSLKNAYAWVRKAAATGHPRAVNVLGNYYRLGIGVPYDPVQAFKLARKSALSGWPAGMRRLADAHEKGIGTARDRQLAAIWYRKAYDANLAAAMQGDATAMQSVAWAHYYGNVGNRDYSLTIEWLKKALAGGVTNARHGLGWMYDNSLGVKKDHKRACDYYEMAASDNRSSSLNSYGTCFKRGKGRKRDYVRAKKLFERAIAGGNRFAPRNLAQLYRDGKGVKKDLKKAAALFRMSAERGLPVAMLNYGWVLDHGLGIESDPQAACDWYRRAADRYHGTSMNNLAVCFKTGRGRAKDLARAVHWFERSAATGNSLALHNLAESYEAGLGVTRDPVRATHLFGVAARAGNVAAMVRYGFNLDEGRGIRQNKKLACDWYKKATDAKSAAAANNLAMCYATGQGRAKDPERAIELLELAIARGDTLAKRNLGLRLRTGDNVKPDVTRGNKLLRQAAEAGDATAMLHHAYQLLRNNRKASRKLACRWFEKAARIEAARAAAQLPLGYCWEKGWGRKRNRKKAFAAYLATAKAGNQLGMKHLARAYDEGIGTRRNGDKAAFWLRKSLEAGNSALATHLISSPSAWRRSTRRALQKILKKEGIYSGPANGSFTAEFDQALWQRAVGATRPGQTGRLIQEFVRVPVKGAPRGLLVRLCRRPSKAKQPLIVINHGLTTVAAERRKMRPAACGGIAEFFTSRGYVVAFPLRRGYGETAGRFAESAVGRCRSSRIRRAGLAAANDMNAVIQMLDKRAGIKPGETIVLGHSGGGWGAIALASINPDNVRAYINFSGGQTTTKRTPGTFCPKSLTAAAGIFGKTASKPTLWLYVQNDSYIGPSIARRMFRAYEKAGGNASFTMLPRFENEGHYLFRDDVTEVWGKPIDTWLASIK